jgi:hypothetical protein
VQAETLQMLANHRVKVITFPTHQQYLPKPWSKPFRQFQKVNELQAHPGFRRNDRRIYQVNFPYNEADPRGR